MKYDDIRALSLVEARDAIASGALTAEAVTRAAIEQAERFKDEYALFVTFTPDQALAQARAADQARVAGKPLGPLHGVPITIKDNIDVAGVRTTAGSKVLADRVPARHATAVQKLLDAGAISLGQTNMHEMALGGTSTNPHYGAVRNPWAPERVPGGSSGGATACVSLQIGYAALGTDSAGSVRMPASYCGLVGLKQTHGLVSLAGVVPTGTWSTDHIGPITRTVADAALLLELMQGYDPADPDSTTRLPAPYPALESLGGLRVGVPENYFWDGVDVEVESICRACIARLGAAGATLVPVRFETADLINLARPAMMAEPAIFHEPYLRERMDDYGEDIRYRLLTGQYVLATDYIRSLRARRLVMEEFARVAATVDVVVTPTMLIPPPPIGATSVPVNGADTPLTWATASLLFVHNTVPLNQSGLPAISLPAGLTAAGLPVGLQLFCGAFEDTKLLAIAAVVEQLIGFDTTPPALRALEPVA